MKAKILVVGPPKVMAGKTTLSNILADLSEAKDINYKPTVGCRILEFEIQNFYDVKKNRKMDIELWDCSGDKKFSTCWPAIAKDAQGAILVYDPSETDSNALYPWFDYFILQQGLRDSQCVIAEILKNDSQRYNQISGTMSSLSMIRIRQEDDVDVARKDFNNYFATVITEISERRDQEELNLINM